MTDFIDMVNEPIAVTINGMGFMAKSPKIKDLVAKVEKRIREEHLAAAKESADAFELQGAAREVFLRQAFSECPKGADLQQAAWDYLATGEGLAEIFYAAGKDHNPGLTVDDYLNMVMGAPEEATIWAEFLCGSGDLAAKKRDQRLADMARMQELAAKKKEMALTRMEKEAQEEEPSSPQ